ncbi:MAG: hypothetical protein Q7J98_08650 [Kiritimatiellia bacterium]|nr:hypothetical protein [Kiritimatiellia bacterium]
MTIYDELQALIKQFRKLKVEYALCGGLAMATHGWPRTTMDIDMLIEEKDLTTACTIAKSLGFKHTAHKMYFCNGKIKIHRLVKLAGAEAIPLDLLTVTPALRQVWKQRATLESAYGPICVVSAKGLAMMKGLRKSGQDKDDIRKLKGIDASKD